MRASETLPSFRQYATTLGAIGEIKYCSEWIEKNYAQLTTQQGMSKALQGIFLDPASPIAALKGSPTLLSDHWLFRSMMALLREETGRADGYGYAGLSADTGIVDGITGGYISVADFGSRKAPLSPQLLQAISTAFSKHLVRIGAKTASKLMVSSVRGQAEAIFNFQMMNYRYFNPIDWLVSDALNKAQLGHELPANHDSFLSASKDAVASRTGNLINVDGGRVWIKCQSAYDGRIDKRKELCGRVGAMKLCYSAKELSKRRFLLVIDGSFDDEDLRLFVQAGWDGVYYFDELDDLVAAVRA